MTDFSLPRVGENEDDIFQNFDYNSVDSLPTYFDYTRDSNGNILISKYHDLKCRPCITIPEKVVGFEPNSQPFKGCRYLKNNWNKCTQRQFM